MFRAPSWCGSCRAPRELANPSTVSAKLLRIAENGRRACLLLCPFLPDGDCSETAHRGDCCHPPRLLCTDTRGPSGGSHGHPVEKHTKHTPKRPQNLAKSEFCKKGVVCGLGGTGNPRLRAGGGSRWCAPATHNTVRPNFRDFHRKSCTKYSMRRPASSTPSALSCEATEKKRGRHSCREREPHRGSACPWARGSFLEVDVLRLPEQGAALQPQQPALPHEVVRRDPALQVRRPRHLVRKSGLTTWCTNALSFVPAGREFLTQPYQSGAWQRKSKFLKVKQDGEIFKKSGSFEKIGNPQVR